MYWWKFFYAIVKTKVIVNKKSMHKCLWQGMVLVSPESTFLNFVCRFFEADIYLLYHSHRISKGFETTVHVGNVCQICKVEIIVDKVCTCLLVCSWLQLFKSDFSASVRFWNEKKIVFTCSLESTESMKVKKMVYSFLLGVNKDEWKGTCLIPVPEAARVCETRVQTSLPTGNDQRNGRGPQGSSLRRRFPRSWSNGHWSEWCFWCLCPGYWWKG